MPVADLGALIERCGRGDELAWEALVRRFQARIYSLAYHYLRDPEEARDAAQETFVHVYRGLERFGGGAFVPWLLRVARNCCLDRLRRRKARPPATDVELDRGVELTDLAPDPEQSWLKDSRTRLVHQAMEGMSDRSREILLLKEIQGLSFPEIARMLDQPVGTVKSRSNRARLELARRVVALDPSYGAT